MKKLDFYVLITCEKDEDFKKLLGMHELDLECQPRKKSGNKILVSGLLTKEEINQLKELGFGIKIEKDISKYDSRKEVSKTNRYQSELDKLLKEKRVNDALS